MRPHQRVDSFVPFLHIVTKWTERLDLRSGNSDKTHSYGTLRGAAFCAKPSWPCLWYQHTSRVTYRETAEHGEDTTMPRRYTSLGIWLEVRSTCARRCCQVSTSHTWPPTRQLVILTLQWQHHQASRRATPCQKARLASACFTKYEAAAIKLN